MGTSSTTWDYVVKVNVKRLHDEFGRAIYQDVKMRRLPDDIIIGLQIPVSVIDDIIFDIKTELRR